jgi:CubicO group peptidase (beta-lactamase class C family)
MGQWISVALLSAVLFCTGCAKPESQDDAEAPATEDAITRVTAGLLPAVTEQGRLGQRGSILERMAHYGVPGLAVAVIHEGEVVWERAFGVTEAGGDEPVTVETMFQAASISKPVTATAVLLLAQNGIIDLEDTLNTRLKSWIVPENDFTRAHPVTVRGLLSHTSGFSGNNGVDGYVPGTAVPSLIQALNGEPPATTGPVHVTHPVGTFDYSGSNYAVLQQLLVDVSERPFTELMRDTVFAPLGMHRSTFGQSPSMADIAKGHLAQGEPLPGGYWVHSGEAAAGLWSTTSDLAKFAISVQQAVSAKSEGLLMQAMAQEMLQPQVRDCARCWGLGFEILGQGAESWFTHDGINAGFDSKLIAHSSSGDGAVVMTNGNLSFGLIHEILDRLAEEYDWPDYSVKGQTESVPIPAGSLAAIPGEYELEPDVPVIIVADSGRLFMDLPPLGRTELYASSPTSFFNTAIDWGPMTFVTDDAGHVTDMMIGHPGQQSTHRRLRE